MSTEKFFLFDYHNDPKFSERQVWENSADQDQTAPDQGLHCLQSCLHFIWTHHSMVKPLCSHFRLITANFFRCLNVLEFLQYSRMVLNNCHLVSSLQDHDNFGDFCSHKEQHKTCRKDALYPSHSDSSTENNCYTKFRCSQFLSSCLPEILLLENQRHWGMNFWVIIHMSCMMQQLLVFDSFHTLSKLFLLNNPCSNYFQRPNKIYS